MQCIPGEFSGPFQCLRATMMGEGVIALWRGATPALMGALSENIVAFGVNGK